MFVTNWILTTKIQKISEITNFFRHYFLSRTEVIYDNRSSEGKTILVCSLLDRLKFCLVMEYLQVWRELKKPLRRFIPSLKEKYIFS